MESSDNILSLSFIESNTISDNDLSLETLKGSNTISDKEVSNFDLKRDNSNFKSNGISSSDNIFGGNDVEGIEEVVEIDWDGVGVKKYSCWYLMIAF